MNELVRLDKKERGKIIRASNKALENSIACQTEIKTRTAQEAIGLLRKHAANNEKALNAFIGKIAEINDRLELLRWYTDNHMECEPANINWGHVGSAAHVVEQLEELIDFLGITKQAKG